VYADPVFQTTVVAGDNDSIESILEDRPDFFGEMERFVEAGGLALILGIEPESLESFQPLLGDSAEILDSLSNEVEVQTKESSLLWGTTLEGWKSLFQRSTIAGDDGTGVLLRETDEMKVLVQPGRMGILKRGDGEVVVLQVDVESVERETLAGVLRQLLTNLEVQLPVGSSCALGSSH
jgi:hypothetical protein